MTRLPLSLFPLLMGGTHWCKDLGPGNRETDVGLPPHSAPKRPRISLLTSPRCHHLWYAGKTSCTSGAPRENSGVTGERNSQPGPGPDQGWDSQDSVSEKGAPCPCPSHSPPQCSCQYSAPHGHLIVSVRRQQTGRGQGSRLA